MQAPFTEEASILESEMSAVLPECPDSEEGCLSGMCPRRGTQQDVLNVMGALYAATLFLGECTCCRPFADSLSCSY